MKKQYRFYESSFLKYTVELYEDGELRKSEKVWKDKLDSFIADLEKQGYTYGYTEAELGVVKFNYQKIAKNLIKRK